MDEFIRQAYADGMLNDDSHIAPDPIDQNPPSLYDTTQSSVTTIITTSITANQISTSIDQQEEIWISDDDDIDNKNHLSQINIPPLSSTLYYNQTSYLSSPAPPPPPPPPVQPAIIKVSLPYTYLSLIRQQTFPLNTNSQDFSIKGCFSSLVSNPRLINNEFDLQAYLNDGSDCLLVRLASDLLAQRIGITVAELMTKRKECKNDLDKQKFQMDFNERLKKFGHSMGRLNALMTIRFFSDNQIPMVIKINES